MTCGRVKKKKIDGQSAAKGPGNRIKVQRLDGVIFTPMVKDKTSTSARVFLIENKI